ncbi:MAG: hypothetical protein K0U74_06670 [Alphaproteobacteria bacterium]|nr:hypothetical protein [Alphaproteobacteria bacterium]
MSLFEKPPSEFPFAAQLGDPPVSFVIKSDFTDRIVTTVLAVFWLLFGTAVIYMLVHETIGTEPAWQETANWAAIGLCLAYIGAALAYFTPAVLENFRTVAVTITEHEVAVSVATPISRISWRDPLTVYEGVANLNLGMHDLGDEKVVVGSVVLKHPDPARSIPVVIREQQRIGKNTVRKVAQHFQLPVLEGVGDESGQAAYPDGTLVVNKWQSLKVRLVYWAMILVFALLAILVVRQVATGAEGPGSLLWLPLFAGLIGLMQVFGSCYVTAMREWQGDIWIRTAAIQFREYKIAPKRVHGIKRFEGGSRGATTSTQPRTPWIKLSVRGHLLPFVIDLQADYVNENGIYKLTKS